MIPLEIVGDVSEGFVAEVRGVLARVAPAVLAEVAAAGVTIVVASQVGDALPQWAGDAPRGWPAGQTWNHAEGCYEPSTRQVVVAEWFLDPRAGDRRTRSYRMAGCLLHELGHALDESIAPQHAVASAFQSAHTAGLARLAEHCPPALEYERQAGLAGAEEAFAEAFALHHGERTGPPAMPELYARYFPEVMEYVDVLDRGDP